MLKAYGSPLPDAQAGQPRPRALASGLPALDLDRWRAALNALEGLPRQMRVFLESWTQRMEAGGYLSFTTARRTDCTASFLALYQPMMRHGEGAVPPTFEGLTAHSDGWEQPLLESGLRHWRRGITGTMFLGCFKTFIYALEDALEALAVEAGASRPPAKAFADARLLLHMYAEAFEVLWMDACLARQGHERASDQDAFYRLLTLEKCRFENVLNTSSDGMLVIDSGGLVTTINHSLRGYAKDRRLEGRPVWEVLRLDASSPDEFFRNYPVGQTVEIAPFGDQTVFRFSLAPLGDVSLASDEFLILLSNITPQVRERQNLEHIVAQRTAQLVQEKQHIEEMNITLRNVLRNVEAERQRLYQEVGDKVRQLILPTLARVEFDQAQSIRTAYADMLRDHITRILPGTRHDEPLLLKFTLAETKVCQLIEAGHSSKEVAAMLRISPETVQTHRRSIRKKLGIRGRDTQLSALLQSRRLPE